MKKYFLVISIFLQFNLYAGEGMWIPMLLQQQNVKEMQSMGLKLSADDIYSINKSCLKDAVLLFGGGCTAEIVSGQGLILTNHHCGVSYVQSHSSLEHDYLANGFWAKNKTEELSCPGLTVSLLIRMEDVTAKVLQGLQDHMREYSRDSLISANIKVIEKESVRDTPYQAKVKSFYYGNQFYLIISEVFKDIRLAGAPPVNIGQFGGDTDNWMWPRHTGDFTVFRIYADKNGDPAEYSKDNIPYKPKYHLPVSLKGYKEGDFTFVYGYPGTTQEYITSDAVELISLFENPARIKLRGIRLSVMNKYMDESRLTRLQYTTKAAGIANGWKKWQGECKGIKRLEVVDKKKEKEVEFQRWVDADAKRKGNYGALLPEFKKTYESLRPYDMAWVYYSEVGNGIEIFRFARQFNNLVKMSGDRKSSDEDLRKTLEQLKKSVAGFFKNYCLAVDKEITPSLLKEYASNTGAEFCPAILRSFDKKTDDDLNRLADKLFTRSMFTGEQKLMQFLTDYRRKDYKKILKDPVYDLANQLYEAFEEKVLDKLSIFRRKIDSLQRIYMEALIEMSAGTRMYPDANLSLRVTYGNVSSYEPADAVKYLYFTTLDGVMAKEDTAVYDLVVNPKLKELYQKRDYGQYADPDGKIHTCFIASNHTTGGNSGSPVFNAEGQLIGINFDRCWEGTMSDIVYDPLECRNISLDIRYCLFVIDKMCGAGNLVDEMTLVK